MAWLSVAWRGLPWLGAACLGFAWRGAAWSGVAWRVAARCGVAWLSVAWRDSAWIGVTRRGVACRGLSRRVAARGAVGVVIHQNGSEHTAPTDTRTQTDRQTEPRQVRRTDGRALHIYSTQCVSLQPNAASTTSCYELVSSYVVRRRTHTSHALLINIHHGCGVLACG